MRKVINGTEHVFAKNAKMEGSDWSAEYPPIKTTAKFLRCKETGNIYPNTPEFAKRSDILEPFFGDPKNPTGSATVNVSESAIPATF